MATLLEVAEVGRHLAVVVARPRVVMDTRLEAAGVVDRPPVAVAAADRPPVAVAVADRPPVAVAVADRPPVAAEVAGPERLVAVAEAGSGSEAASWVAESD